MRAGDVKACQVPNRFENCWWMIARGDSLEIRSLCPLGLFARLL